MDLPLSEFEEVGNIVRQQLNDVADDIKIIAGMSISNEVNDNLMITIVATNLTSDPSSLPPLGDLRNSGNHKLFEKPCAPKKEEIKQPEEAKETPKEEEEWSLPDFLNYRE